MKRASGILLVALMAATGCTHLDGTPNLVATGGLVGAGAGAAVGALIGGGLGTAAITGGAIGALAGAAIGANEERKAGG